MKGHGFIIASCILLLAGHSMAATQYVMEMSTNDQGEVIAQLRDASGRVLLVTTNRPASATLEEENDEQSTQLLPTPAGDVPGPADTSGPEPSTPTVTTETYVNEEGNRVSSTTVENDSLATGVARDSEGNRATVTQHETDDMAVETVRVQENGTNLTINTVKQANQSQTMLKDDQGNWVITSSQTLGNVTILTVKDSKGNIERVQRQQIGDKTLVIYRDADGKVHRKWIENEE